MSQQVGMFGQKVGGFLGWVALTFVALASLQAGPELRSREWAIGEFKPPPRWEVTPRERPSYPQLIAWASRGDGSERAVISLVGKRVAPGTTVRELLPDASAIKGWPRVDNVRVQILSTLGWTTGWTGNLRLQVDAVLTATERERAQVVRQYLFLNGPIAYTMTLVAPDRSDLWWELAILDSRSGNLKRAIATLERFLDERPAASGRSELEDLLQRLRGRVH